jgi:hypothetical protein
LVVVAVAATVAIVALSRAGDDLPGPAVLNANADESAYSITHEHSHTSRISLIDWDDLPRASRQSVSVRVATEGYCVGNERRPVVEHADVKESARVVVVGPATVHEFAPSGGGCAGIGYDAPVKVELRHPLGDRAVLTSATRSRFGGGRTLWPSEDQFQCIRRVGGRRADRRLFGAVARDEIETEKQLAGVLYMDRMWGVQCGLSTR